jgi:hypothetical protein
LRIGLRDFGLLCPRLDGRRSQGEGERQCELFFDQSTLLESSSGAAPHRDLSSITRQIRGNSRHSAKSPTACRLLHAISTSGP